MLDQPIILGWQCPTCETIYYKSGFCSYDGYFLKPLVEQIEE